jgi:hypothetical protein
MAYIARSKLESAGIPCVLENEYLVGIHWLYSNAIGGVTLKVPEDVAAEATALLGEDNGEISEQEPDDPETSVCPRCGGTDITPLTFGRPFAALSMLIGIPVPVSGKRHHCRKCGKIWK